MRMYGYKTRKKKKEKHGRAYEKCKRRRWRSEERTVTVAFISASISIRSWREKYKVASPPRKKEGACKGCVIACLTRHRPTPFANL